MKLTTEDHAEWQHGINESELLVRKTTEGKTRSVKFVRSASNINHPGQAAQVQCDESVFPVGDEPLAKDFSSIQDLWWRFDLSVQYITFCLILSKFNPFRVGFSLTSHSRIISGLI